MPDEIGRTLDGHLKLEPIVQVHNMFGMMLGQKLLDQTPRRSAEVCHLQIKAVYIQNNRVESPQWWHRADLRGLLLP